MNLVVASQIILAQKSHLRKMKTPDFSRGRIIGVCLQEKGCLENKN